jgi:hypothetical protein
VKLTKDLREFVVLLNSHRVEYVVVGGHAVAYHGHPRYTGDTDFFVRPSRDNAQRVLAVLDAFGFGEVGISNDDLTQPGRIIQLGYPPNRIDLITGITGVDFDEAWSGRVQTTLDGLPVPFLGRDALLKNKRAAGRAQDLADADALDGDGDEP